jgi:CheY-like chemotaxis protein
MHGSIELESQPNVGSKATFSVQFKRGRSSKDDPLSFGPQTLYTATLNTVHVPDLEACSLRSPSPAAGDVITMNGIQSELSGAARARTQILVVEDNAINQNYAVQIIKRLGFPVQAVWNGRDALEYLANPTTATPRPHIILMDCQMPIMDGYETTRRLRNSADVSIDASLRMIPVIALTASAIKGDKEKCEAAGMDDYITKPVSKQDLEKVLVRWALRT